ncbi:MAG: glycosyltransferase family 4 protein [Thermoanaerobaculia bacterium]
MKVLHLASVNRWTGAAAPAFAEVEALRAAGVEAFFAFSGGYKLETKLASLPFAYPIIRDEQDPFSYILSVRAVNRLIRKLGADIVHAHLTHDHAVAVAAVRGTGASVVRTFHRRRTLRSDPFTHALLRRTAAIAFVNAGFAGAYAHREALFTPPPVNGELFSATGPDAREIWGLQAEDVVLGIIGKLAPHRGFEDALQCVAILRERGLKARLLVVGAGGHETALRTHAGRLGVADAVIWAGYQEERLAEHYRALDLLLFTAAGSDEGHRAVVEALACGRAVAAYPLEGVATLLGSAGSAWISPEAVPGSLVRTIEAMLRQPEPERRGRAVVLAETFGYERAAERLRSLYSSIPEASKLA